MNKELSKKISFLLIHEILIGCLVFPKIEKACQNEKNFFVLVCFLKLSI